MLDGFLIYLQGCLIGLAIAAPVGPVGLLCIRKTLENGILVGFTIGLGSAVADTLFGIIALFGVNAIVTSFAGYDSLFRLFGGLFLFGIACKIYFSHPRSMLSVPTTRSLLKDFTMGLTITLTNPLTIMSCLALFTGIGVTFVYDRTNAMTMLGGVLCGATIWWLLLSSMVSLMRQQLSEMYIHRINNLVGVALIVVGVGVILSAVNWYAMPIL